MSELLREWIFMGLLIVDFSHPAVFPAEGVQEYQEKTPGVITLVLLNIFFMWDHCRAGNLRVRTRWETPGLFAPALEQRQLDITLCLPYPLALFHCNLVQVKPNSGVKTLLPSGMKCSLTPCE